MSEKKMNFCLFLPNWVGDVVMATPAFRLLHQHFGRDATFTGIGRPFLLDLLDGVDWFDHYIPLHPKSSDPELGQQRVVRKIRQQKFDVGVLFPNSMRSAMIAWFGGIPYRIGYARHGRRFLLTHPIKAPADNIPLVDYNLGLAEALIQYAFEKTGYPGFRTDTYSDVEKRHLELRTSEEEESLGDRIWDNLGLQPPDKVVMLHVGSASSVMKYWSTEHAAVLSRMIVDRLGMDVLINCGPGEIDTAREIVRSSQRDRVFSLADQPLNIHAGKICLKRARATVSTDSGPLHIATAFGKPTLVLLGPTDDTYIANPASDMRILSRHLECSPCYNKVRCPLKHHRCMMDLTPEFVFDELARILDR